MPVLVTGAAGLVGSHVVDALLRRKAVVRALLLPREPAARLLEAGVEVVRGDLGDPASLRGAVAGVDRVLHCAARTGPWGPRPEYERANVAGLRALLEAARAAGVRRLVHVSSAIVHGTDAPAPRDESAPLRPEPNPYSWSKIEGERLLEAAAREGGLEVVVVRPGLVFGPRDAGSFGRFARMLERGEMVQIGDGRNHLPLVYVGDVAEAVVLASEAPGAAGRAYLVVNDEPVTQREYLAALAAELGVPPPRRRIPYRVALTLAQLAEALVRVSGRAGPPPLTRFGVRMLGGENRFVIRRAREELGFEPRVGLAEGVRRGVAWYRAEARARAEEART
ncbi:NAD-dependent epimerase/dehydratase family protein [Anaeromyxobacter paludicola]|uniref:3-beta hydroxysteroid dehydrogenase n=1 Tax=Anaeromyxobacter paludicola TaxID=2918171 RepID=A0ABN6N2J4_9BACT|nr:NAD-dependent epimerase/dehydratase family protein [Anaeromyxobacter paludicola]BDG07429.1 3-beta hydroxysteroid dehydrogenase [Anaeromyxobacter paludicola]